MRLLLDTCVWGGARLVLVEAGHDVVWAGEWASDPGEEEILAIAHQEGRVMVTLDKDFGELTILHGRPHSGILRLVGLPARMQGRASTQVLASHGHLLEKGCILTVEPGRLRIREP